MQFLNLFKQRKNLADFFRDDKHFNKLYPYHIRMLAERHWTPVKIARAAALFLGAESGSRILDIGSGVGKFCLCAAQLKPDCFFFGIEQRENLVHCAEKVKGKLGLNNAFFVHANMTMIDFNAYHHFYFFNSFYEHLEPDVKIDRNIQHSIEFYDYYSKYFFDQLEILRPGTRLCTYHGRETQVPGSYRLVDSLYDEKLKFWIKE